MGFIQEYFILPITQHTGYNIINTSAYALIAIAIIYFTAIIFRAFGIKTKDVFGEIIPYVFIGGMLRALQDVGFFSTLGGAQYLFETPLIYFMLYFIVFSLIIIEKKMHRTVMPQLGWLFAAMLAVKLMSLVKNSDGFIITIVLTAAVMALTVSIMKFVKIELVQRENLIVLSGHALDACSSVTAISIVGGFTEQHVLPNALFSFMPFYLFIPLKIIIVLAALYIMDKNIKNAELKGLMKIALLAVGLGPGIRNVLAMAI